MPPEASRSETSQATGLDTGSREEALPSVTSIAAATATATAKPDEADELAERSAGGMEPKVAPDLPPPQRFVMSAAALTPSEVPVPAVAKKATAPVQSRSRITKLPLVVRGHEPRLEVSWREGARQAVLWTLESLAAGIPPVSVTLGPPSDKSKPAWSWTPLLRVRADDKVLSVIRGRAAWETQRLDLNLDKATLGEEGMTVALTAGVSGSRDGETLRSFGGPSRTLRLRSLADLSTEALTVTVSLERGSGRDEGAGGWLEESRFLGKRDDASLLRIGLRRGRDAAKLFPLLADSGGFRVDPGVEEFGSPSDLTLVRDQAVVAVVVGGRQPNRAMIGRLARLLAADFAYLGAAAALIPKTADLAAIEAESRSVFAFNVGHGDLFYGMRQIFLGDYPNVERFMKANSMALFNRPVELVWRRTADRLTVNWSTSLPQP
jgi:hypothetical protein